MNWVYSTNFDEDQLPNLSRCRIDQCLNLKFIALSLSVYPDENLKSFLTTMKAIPHVNISIGIYSRHSILPIAETLSHSLKGLKVWGSAPLIDPVKLIDSFAAFTNVSTLELDDVTLDGNVLYECVFEMHVLKKVKLGTVRIVGNAQSLNVGERLSDIQYLEFGNVTINWRGFDLCSMMLARMPRLVYLVLHVHGYLILRRLGRSIGYLPDKCVFQYLRLLSLDIDDDSVHGLFNDIQSRSPMIAHLVSPTGCCLVMVRSWFDQPDRLADVEFGPLDNINSLSQRIFRLDQYPTG